MDELRALYRSLLADHRHSLETLRPQAVGGDEDAWDAILREAHTLKGSGGQFGFPEITNAARALREAPVMARLPLLDALLAVVVACMNDQPIPDGPDVDVEASPCVEGAAALRRVLVVEDDPLIGSVICNALRRHGAHPTHCDLGTKAVDCLFEDPSTTPPYDLVLLDISMPGLSGLDVLARIRREPTTADLPVMMVSAHNDASTITYARALGADDYLTKPFAPATLLRHVDALVAARALGPVPHSGLPQA